METKKVSKSVGYDIHDFLKSSSYFLLCSATSNAWPYVLQVLGGSSLSRLSDPTE